MENQRNRLIEYEGRLLCSETGNPARAEVLHVKSLREQAYQSQNLKTGPRLREMCLNYIHICLVLLYISLFP